MPDDLDLLELPAEPPAAAVVARRRRRLRAGIAVVAAGAVAAGAAAALTAGHDPDRTDIDDRPAPVTAPDVMVAPAPAPGAGGAPAATPARPRAPVVEALALRADGGIGRDPPGAPSGVVVADVSAALGPPARSATGRLDEACPAGPTPLPAGSPYRSASWGDLFLVFAGPTPADQHLVSWSVHARPGAPRRFRLAGGPAFDDPLAAWGATFGSAVEVRRLSGDRGQSYVTVHTPGGDVTLVGFAPASANAVVARGGNTCVARDA